MSDTRTVMGLFESREGLRIDERKLSARLRSRIEQVDATLMVFDELKLEVERLGRRNRQYLIFLLASLGVAVVGVTFGSMAFFQGFGEIINTALSVGGGIAIFLADYEIAVIERRIHAIYVRKNGQVKEFTRELEANLDSTYDDVKSEMAAARRGFASLDSLIEPE